MMKVPSALRECSKRDAEHVQATVEEYVQWCFRGTLWELAPTRHGVGWTDYFYRSPSRGRIEVRWTYWATESRSAVIHAVFGPRGGFDHWEIHVWLPNHQVVPFTCGPPWLQQLIDMASFKALDLDRIARENEMVAQAEMALAKESA